MKAGIAVGDEKSSSEPGVWNKPIGVTEANMGGAGPDLALVTQDVLNRLETQLVFGRIL
jgi:hypothetical protein